MAVFKKTDEIPASAESFGFKGARISDTIANPRINAPKQQYETKPNNQHVKYKKKPVQQRQIVHRQTEPSHDA
ncbi:MAG: hypothetical protein J6I42_13190, partial [Clostridia bacterium]|nr:hypothetical protein [Clostridia bacterium]